MSFSADVKEELCRVPLGKKCCAQAEAYGALLFCNHFSAGQIRIVTENAALSLRLPQLFWRAFRIDFDDYPDLLGEEGKQVFGITDPEKVSMIWETYGYEPSTSVSHHINYAVLEENCDRNAFLRGAFLTGGSVTDPRKGYHLELATSHYHVSRELSALMPELGFAPKETTRKANYVTYFKSSAAIEDLLTTIGAPIQAMEIMNAKAEKQLRGGVNRRVNCDAANLGKAVDAAQEQIEAIHRLEERGRLTSLPEKLRQTARLRMENPELTLSELALLCTPPITKSALNHRLKRLMEQAGEKTDDPPERGG